MKNELYFTVFLTESEHSFVEEELSNFCTENGIELVYYRKFKEGHRPGYREVKLKGDVGKFKKYLDSSHLIIDNVNKKVDHKGKKVEKWFKDILIKLDN